MALHEGDVFGGLGTMIRIDSQDAGAPRASEERAENVPRRHRDERAWRWDEDVRPSSLRSTMGYNGGVSPQ